MRRALRALLLAGAAWFLLHSAAVLWDGFHDDLAPSDVAIILGSMVETGGTPSERLRRRLDRGLDLYRDGTVRYLLVSGGVDPRGNDEEAVMRAYLVARGVPPDRVLSDPLGLNTCATARNAVQIMADQGLSSALVVTHYYHVSRTRPAFRRLGLEVRSARARPGFEARDAWSIAREFVGYYAYLAGRCP